MDGPWQEKEEKIRHPLRLTQTAAALLPKASLPPLAPLSLPFDGLPDLSRPGGNPPGRRAGRVPSCWEPSWKSFVVSLSLRWLHINKGMMQRPRPRHAPALDLVQERRGLQF